MQLSDLTTLLGVATREDFNALALQAATLGRPAIPPLMLVARDAKSAIARLCAIKALGMMSDPVAKEARRRIADLPLLDDRAFVFRAAAGNSQWPFHESWDAQVRLEALRAASRRRRPPKIGTVTWGSAKPLNTPPDDYDWREQN